MNPNFKPSFLDIPKSSSEMQNIYLETDLGIIDILSALPQLGHFNEIKSRSLEISLYGKICRLISLEDLITVKESMKRPKDIQALQELKLIQKKSGKKE